VLWLKVPYVPEGLEAIIFTADGDMRQGLNNLQATFSGFQFVNQANVFKVRTNYNLQMVLLKLLFGFRFVTSRIHCM
jgi:DNA polymerase III delta prime subunit